MINVLFVCLGNICRSPMAEAIFRHQIHKEGLDEYITVDSAGTAGYHIGNPPHKGTRAKLDEYDISYDQLEARQVQQADFENFDYIITMDESNNNNLQAAFSHSDKPVVCRIMDFVENAKEENVPDPYLTGDFDYTYELLMEACQELMTYLKKKHHIKG